jgi:hypothetical protein
MQTSIDVLSNKYTPKFRWLQVFSVESDDPCLLATGELYESTTLSNAYNACWDEELATLQLDESSCTALQNRYECDLDSTKL